MKMNTQEKHIIRPSIFSDIDGLIAAQSTRHGGISPAPFNSMNLGKNTNDAVENIHKNRNLLCAELGIDWKQLAFSEQVHADKILFVKTGGGHSGYDALVTDVANVFIAIGTADCAGVLVFDKKNKASAAIHAGWRGSAKLIVGKTLNFMQEHLGTKAEDCLAYVSPCIGAGAFEVGAEVMEQFPSNFSKKTDKEGKYLLDLKATVQKQLTDFGIPTHQIEIDKNCTYSNTIDFFSYRKENGNTGRMLSIIGIQV